MAIAVYCSKMMGGKMFRWLERWRRIRNIRRAMAASAARATDIKYAKMRVNLQMVSHMIKSMLTTHAELISDDKVFRKLIRRYNRVHKRAMRIQIYVQNHDVSHVRMQRYGFTLGRYVIEMRRIYERMDTQLLRLQQQVLMDAAAKRKAEDGTEI